MALNVELLRATFDAVVTPNPNLTHRFYENLFERYPEARGLFKSRPIETQEKMLRDALVAVMDHLEDPPWLRYNLEALGEKHVAYGVGDEMYTWVGEALIATLAETAGSAWTPPVEAAWTEAYGAIAAFMIEGAKRARAEANKGAGKAPRSAV